MPEGPSLVLLRQAVENFDGKKITAVHGNSKIDKERLLKKKVVFKTWGKHFLLCFKDFTVRIHFLLFGSYRINERKGTPERLSVGFAKGELNFYACAVKIFEQHADEIYDWSADVMNDTWNPMAALDKLLLKPEMMVCDALLEQEIFSGVGNIIKNEVLFRMKLHPETLISALSPVQLWRMTQDARSYSFLFLEWKRKFVLKKNYQVHTRKSCPSCNTLLSKKHTGLKKRRSFWCENCQPLSV